MKSEASLLLLYIICVTAFSANHPPSTDNKQYTPPQLQLILRAAETDNVPSIRELLRKIPRVQLTNVTTWTHLEANNKGDTPLHAAARYNQTGALKLLLLSMKELILSENNDHFTPIHVAVTTNSTQAIELLLKEKPSLLEHRESVYDRTPLYLAAEYGHLAMVKLLASLGADLYARSSDEYGGAMAIHEAARWNHIEIVEFLHNRGCSLGLEERWWKRTPLHEACINGSVELVRLLIERGADPYQTSNARDHQYTPLHWAAAMGHLEVIKYLLQHDQALIELGDRDGDKAVHVAALHNQIEVVEYFVAQLKIDVNLRQASFGRTLLHQASGKGYLSLVERLLKLGADPFAESNKMDCHQLPIHLAARKGQLLVVERLLDRFPNLLALRDGCQRSLLDLARNSENKQTSEQIVKLLYDRAGRDEL